MGHRVLRTISLPTFALLAVVSCKVEPAPEESSEVVGVSSQSILHTWYSRDGADRTVYARGPFVGAPRVRLTWRAFGTCYQGEAAMVPISSSNLSWSICASLGLEYGVLNGGINACVASQGSSAPVPIFVHEWSDGWAREVNYRVIDEGIDGTILDDSGWHPNAGNACPRP